MAKDNNTEQYLARWLLIWTNIIEFSKKTFVCDLDQQISHNFEKELACENPEIFPFFY